jgi:hypothetical protein
MWDKKWGGELQERPSSSTTWKVMANHCEIAGCFESQINQAVFNTKGQRKTNKIKPLTLCVD